MKRTSQLTKAESGLVLKSRAGKCRQQGIPPQIVHFQSPITISDPYSLSIRMVTVY